MHDQPLNVEEIVVFGGRSSPFLLQAFDSALGAQARHAGEQKKCCVRIPRCVRAFCFHCSFRVVISGRTFPDIASNHEHKEEWVKRAVYEPTLLPKEGECAVSDL